MTLLPSALLLCLLAQLPAAAQVSPATPAPPAATALPASAPAGGPRVLPSLAGPSILFVSFDTLRRDHVSCYGAERLTTPRVDALARSGARFTDCQATIPVTGPGHAAILSGLYPQTHGAFRNGVRMVEGTWLLPAALQRRGYRTAAFIAGWTLKGRQCGLDAGFETYDEDGMDERYGVVNLMRRADGVTNAALRWFDTWREGSDRARPWFAFVHYFDPHEPYDGPLPPPAANPASTGPGGASARQQLPAYDAEIAYTDREFGRLLDGLAERGLSDDVIIVFTSDHGQSFGEHGEGGPEGAHGRRTYQSTLAVPLVISWPGKVLANRVIDLPMSHLDIVPTLAALAGLAEGDVPAGLPGASLLTTLQQEDAPPPWGSAERVRHSLAFAGAVGNKWNIFRWMQNRKVDNALPLRACAIVGSTKIIIDPKRPLRIEAYDLQVDPYERSPLEDPAKRLESWGPRILEWYERTRIDLVDTQPDPEDLEKLRALGYVGG